MRQADALTLPVFFKHPVGLTVGEIAALTGAKLRTGTRLDDLITNVAPLDRAGASDLAFLDTAKYADVLTSTRAEGWIAAVDGTPSASNNEDGRKESSNSRRATITNAR